MVTRIVISGGWSYGNLGDEIIAKCTIDLLNRYFPEVEKVYTSYEPKDFFEIHNIEAIESLHAIFAKAGYGIEDVDKCVMNPDKYGGAEYSALFDTSTLFIMSGGGYFDGTWYSQFAARIAELKIAQNAGAKTIILGQSIGPIVDENECKMLREVLEKCEYLNVRDDDSKELLQSIVPNKYISCTCDLAVTISDLMPLSFQKENKCNLIVQIYTEHVENGILKGPQNEFFEKLKKRILFRQYRYDIAWIRLLRMIRKHSKYKCQIVLNVQGTEKISNSHFMRYAKRLKKFSGYREMEIINCKSIQEFCNRLATAEMILSCKMHPLIISSSYGVKTYALSQHYKIDAYMKWIGREEMCCKNSRFNPKVLVRQMFNENENVQKMSLEMIEQRKQEVYQIFEALTKM